MQRSDKDKLSILAKRARLERFGNLSEFSRISKILSDREDKVRQVEFQILELDSKIRELEVNSAIPALFSGSGKKVRQFSDYSESLKSKKNDLQVLRAELQSNLERAVKRHEAIREIYAASQTKLTKLEDKNELSQLNELEERAYVEEVGLIDGSRLSKSKGSGLVKN